MERETPNSYLLVDQPSLLSSLLLPPRLASAPNQTERGEEQISGLTAPSNPASGEREREGEIITSGLSPLLLLLRISGGWAAEEDALRGNQTPF